LPKNVTFKLPPTHDLIYASNFCTWASETLWCSGTRNFRSHFSSEISSRDL